MTIVWIVLLCAGAAFGSTALFVLMRAVKQGAFDDAEDIKYAVFRDEEEEYDTPPE